MPGVGCLRTFPGSAIPSRSVLSSAVYASTSLSPRLRVAELGDRVARRHRRADLVRSAGSTAVPQDDASTACGRRVGG